MIGRSAADAKRRIGGHFGSAVGASTKRGRGAAWRDEVEVSESVAAKDGSDSDVALDPGTPLPSESEEEAAATAFAEDTSESIACVGPNSNFNGSSTENSEDRTCDTIGAQAVATEAGQDAALLSEVPHSVTSQSPAVIVMELVQGERTLSSARVLLREGLGDATEKRLAACISQGGGVDELVKDVACTFGGHGPLPVTARGRKHVAPESVTQAEGLPEEAEIEEEPAAATSSSGQARHAGIGLLWEPVEGSGLALTLGSTGSQILESTHRLLGPMLTGKFLLRRLQVLAPLVGGLSPHKPIALRALGPNPTQISKAVSTDSANEHVGDKGMANPSIPHPLLHLERAPPSSANGQAFVSEVGEAFVAAEELDIAGLEVDCREGEVAELKEMAFSRQRQRGVEDVIATLQKLEDRLAALGPLAPPEVGEGCGSAVSGTSEAPLQRWWLSQRVQRLLRVLLKLR